MTDAESAALVKLWKSRGVIGSRLAYPATNVSRADVRARLILVDLLAGDVASAAEKLAAFRRLHSTATGRLAGQDGPLAERLTTLVTQAREWPKPATSSVWSTFAANQHRSGQSAGRLAIPVALSKPAWRLAVGKPLASNVESDRQIIQRQPRIGETWNGILAYHPVMDGKRVFIAHAEGISALDAATGRPLWGTASGDSLTAADALIFRDDGFMLPRTNQWTRGVPRFTLTLHGDRLIARVGPPATSLPTESRAVPATARSKIVVLDVSPAGQGRLAVDPIELEDELLAFDGTPVTDGRSLYAVLRRSDVRPEVLVACYDLQTNPPRERWRTSVAAAETPGSGQVYELTHNLLTLDGDTIYFNTNLGAVVALDCENGDVRWLHTYPRVKLGDLRRLADTGHFYRDLTPCVVHQDAVIVAPFDSPAIMLLDAATGAVRWSTDAAPDAIHLLGAHGETLWASGDRLHAVDLRSGQLRGRWPEAVQPDPRGLGRGAIVGDVVLWPTRHELFVFGADVPDAARSLTKKQAPIDWSKLGMTGGNLVWCEGRLIVATESDIFAFMPDLSTNPPNRNR
jgi:outer membrane protein assembly factor BamB